MKICKACKSPMPDNAHTCPTCGQPEITYGMLFIALLITSPFLVCGCLIIWLIFASY